MYGSRGRVGVVSPARGDTSTYEFYKVAPDGVMYVNASLGVQRLSKEQLLAVLDRYEAAVRELEYEQCDVMILSGTPPVTSGEPGTEELLLARARAITKVPVFTGVSAEVEALQAVGARRIAVGTPYTDDLNEKWRRYFTLRGFEVVAVDGLGIERNVEIAKLPVSASDGVARRLFEEHPDVDAIHLTCPRWATVVNLTRLEQDLGIPVTSSSQAQIYGALSRLAIHDRITGFGSLLERLAMHAPPMRAAAGLPT